MHRGHKFCYLRGPFKGHKPENDENDRLSSHRYGKQVARKPFLVAFIAAVLCATLSVGLITFKEEGNPFKLWIPQDSDFVKNTKWLWQNFPPDSRFHAVILEADNVLEPSVLKHVRFPGLLSGLFFFSYSQLTAAHSFSDS